MITGIGNDIIEIARIERAISRYGQKFLDRCFTKEEQEYCLRHSESRRNFAGRFAAKEAIVKALGTGFGEEINWQDIEIRNDARGRPEVKISQNAETKLNIHPTIHLSISHCKTYATAFAIATN